MVTIGIILLPWGRRPPRSTNSTVPWRIAKTRVQICFNKPDCNKTGTAQAEHGSAPPSSIWCMSDKPQARVEHPILRSLHRNASLTTNS